MIHGLELHLNFEKAALNGSIVLVSFALVTIVLSVVLGVSMKFMWNLVSAL